MSPSLHQAHKKLALEFSNRLLAAKPGSAMTEVTPLLMADFIWHGPHPFNALSGIDVFEREFWIPLRSALPDLSRRNDILIAGRFHERDWVCATGYYTGTFAGDWLGIPAHGGVLNVRFGEFIEFRDGKIAQVRVLLDLLDVMRQAGIRILAPSLGQEGLVSGPSTHDGVILEAVDQAESRKSLELVEAMIGGLGRFDGETLQSMGMERFWHPNMMWYGPSGIGTTRGIGGFQAYHQQPFLQALPDRKGGNHLARFAEGAYCASTGWPSMYATHKGGGWMGLPPTGRRLEMRIMDFWRREGDMLVENWVFIDLIDVLRQMGFDVFARMRAQLQGGGRL
ncbi:MAG: nuclear transport factor 2 family protein [Sphingomonadales bacterium]